MDSNEDQNDASVDPKLGSLHSPEEGTESCVVTGRASKYRRDQFDARDGIQASFPPYLPLQRRSFDADALADSITDTQPNLDTLDMPAPAPERPGSTSDHITRVVNDETGDGMGSGVACEEWQGQSSESQGKSVDDALHASYQTRSGNIPRPPSIADNHWASNVHSRSASDIVYCYYSFLAIDNLAGIPHQDFNFLEAQGCLRVPIRPFLDELVQQYFLHVHPILPLVNEGDFWELYYQNPATPTTDRVSLLVFQAMLFASCNFISQAAIEGLGYADIRSLKACYLRRTKLLYGLGSESSPLSLAQAALLLSFTSLTSTGKPNTSWLSLAIENAKLAEAHLYVTTPPSSMQNQKRNILKRVWWSCIIRDRSIGLLMRRPIQIAKDHFDFVACPLGVEDLEDEFERSKVYNRATKKRLAEILAQSIKLNITLTDILMLVSPLDDTRGWNEENHSDQSSQIRECKNALKRWHTSASLHLRLEATPTIARDGQERNHDSIILYTNFVYMYYHTSRIVLCHHEVLHLGVLQREVDKSKSLTNDLSIILSNRHELQEAATCITECHKNLVRLGLARWLPASAIGCTALPLVLNILDIKLSPPIDAPAYNIASALKQHQLNILIQVMKTYQPQYDGVDWISEIVRHIVNLAQLDDPRPKNQNSNINWTDIFAFQPSSYLRLTLALDLSLSKGRLPQDRDFPQNLRGLFAVDFSPLRELVQASSTSHINNSNPSSNLLHQTSDSSDSPTDHSDSAARAQRYASGADESAIATLEEQIYLHLAGGLAEADMSLWQELSELPASSTQETTSPREGSKSGEDGVDV